MELELLRGRKCRRRQAGSRKRRVAANPTHVGGAWRSRCRLPRTTRSAAVRSTWRASASAGSPTRTLQAHRTREARSVSSRSRKARVICFLRKSGSAAPPAVALHERLREDVDDVDELQHDVGACRDGGERLQGIIAFGGEVEADDDPAKSRRCLRTAGRHGHAQVRRQHVSAEGHRRLLVPRGFADPQGLLATFSIATP